MATVKDYQDWILECLSETWFDSETPADPFPDENGDEDWADMEMESWDSIEAFCYDAAHDIDEDLNIELFKKAMGGLLASKRIVRYKADSAQDFRYVYALAKKS